MAQYEIMKENAILGPFGIDDIVDFVHSGLILKRDYAYDIENPDKFMTVSDLLSMYRKKVTVEHKGNVFSQMKAIGRELIIPSAIFTKEPWEKDGKLFVLSIMGLTLSVLLPIFSYLEEYAIFYCIALYFSVIWGLFFYYLFKTEQVKLRTTIILFFSTQALIFFGYSVLGISSFNPFTGLFVSDNKFLALVACVLGIGVVEEFIKVLPIIFILYFSNNVIKTQTAVFYGLISGISFGVFEGVDYQLGDNYELLFKGDISIMYIHSYVLNIARLTFTPFLHAIFCGIASYYVAFAFLYPRYRVSLYTLAILIPAFIHGMYDWVCFNVQLHFLNIPIVFVGVILLMVYLNARYDFHSKLVD